MVTLQEQRESHRRQKTFSLPNQTDKQQSLVLIADDHGDSREMIKVLLEMRGFRVIEAADGEDAVFMAERNRPNLILMDINLPHLSGLDAARHIRRIENLSRVPIVFLSGHAESRFSDAAFAAGAADYLVKPINLAQLESVVRQNLKRNEEF
jgi:PleD family two-component response regulator